MIQEVGFEEVRHLASLAAKDGVHLTNLASARWWASSEPGPEESALLAGVACLAPVAGGRVRIRSVYVLPSWRGRGHGTALADELILQAPRGKPIEVLAYEPAFYEARGFRRVSSRQARRTVWRLIREATP